MPAWHSLMHWRGPRAGAGSDAQPWHRNGPSHHAQLAPAPPPAQLKWKRAPTLRMGLRLQPIPLSASVVPGTLVRNRRARATRAQPAALRWMGWAHRAGASRALSTLRLPARVLWAQQMGRQLPPRVSVPQLQVPRLPVEPPHRTGWCWCGPAARMTPVQRMRSMPPLPRTGLPHGNQRPPMQSVCLLHVALQHQMGWPSARAPVAVAAQMVLLLLLQTGSLPLPLPTPWSATLLLLLLVPVRKK